MSSSDSEMSIPDSLKDNGNTEVQKDVPENSKEKYLQTYKEFMKWREEKKIKSFSESVFLKYFNGLSSKMKPTTLWAKYSMLKSTLARDNVHLKKYNKLNLFLRNQSMGFRSKKSRMFSPEDIEKFIQEAPDDTYLAMKVAMIFGISGACRCNELTYLTINNIETQGKVLLVKLSNRYERSFVVLERYMPIVEKYQALRPSDITTDRFFLKYQGGKCLNQVIGKNKMASVPKLIASYLKLSDQERYTGHSFRTTALTQLRRHAGLKPREFLGYTEKFVQEKPTQNEIEITVNETVSDEPENIKLSPMSPELSTSVDSPCNPLSDDVPEFTDIKQDLCHNISNSTLNIPNKNLTLNFTNCSYVSINFK